MKKLEIPGHFRSLMRVTQRSSPENVEGFRVNARVRQKLARRKRRIQKRLDNNDLRGCAKPMLTASNIHYQIGDRGRLRGRLEGV
jgi:hypothetical protein